MRGVRGVMALAGMDLSNSIRKSKEKTSFSHIQRTQEPHKMGENIDQDRLHLNKHLVTNMPREVYDEVFGEDLEEYNNKQKRKDRKIKDFYSHTLQNGRAKPYEEFIIGLGNKDDWENTTPEDFEEGIEVVTEMTQTFIENNENFHVISADVHGDESSPHAHVVAIPVGEGYKRGLSKQPSFSKAMDQQGYGRNGFTEWREAQIEAFEPVLSSHGITRKEVGTNGYRSLEDYKSAMHEVEAADAANYEEIKAIAAERLDEFNKREEELERQKEENERQKRINERDKRIALEEEAKREKRFAEWEDTLLSEEEALNAKYKRFNEVLNSIDVAPKYKEVISNYVDTGRTGVVYKKTQEPASYRSVVDKGVNKNMDVRKVEDMIDSKEDEGPEL